MLEKIGKEYYEKLSVPNQLFLEYIRKLKTDTAVAITIAEIGVGIGATAQAVLQTLDINDQYYLFDYSDKVEELSAELSRSIPNTPKIIRMGNSRAALDNYVWSLYNLAVDKSQDTMALFDLVLLDGAHDYTIDLAACALLVNLLKPNGLLILDDIYFNVKALAEHNPLKGKKLKSFYSGLQENAFQIEMICESFLDCHPALQKVAIKDISVAVYRRK